MLAIGIILLIVVLGAFLVNPRDFMTTLALTATVVALLDLCFCTFAPEGWGIGWMLLFWPDWMCRDVVVSDWGWSPTWMVTRVCGYAIVGVCYGTIAATTLTLIGKMKRARK